MLSLYLVEYWELSLVLQIKILSWLLFSLWFHFPAYKQLIHGNFIQVQFNTMDQKQRKEPLHLSSDYSSPTAVQNRHKYTLSVCAVFKDEAIYLKEWIEYHRLVGVDHFYLYNTGSKDRFTTVLKPYIKEGIVSLINWPSVVEQNNEENIFMWSLGVQIPAYENAMKSKAFHETQWLIFLDVDEFLVIPRENDAKAILEKYKNYAGIKISANTFDASAGLSTPARRLLIETVELVKPTPCHPHKSIAKLIFKPSESKGFTWPPYQCHFKNNHQPITLRKYELCLNRYENRFKGHLTFGKIKDKLHVDNRLLTDEECAELLDLGYEIEDQERMIYRFVPDVLKKMGY